MSSQEPRAGGREPGARGPVPGADELARGLLPWPLVAAGLLGVLAVMLGLGLWANQTLRPAFGVTPAAQLQPSATPGPAATPGGPRAAVPASPVATTATARAGTSVPTTGPPVAAASPVASRTPAATSPAAAAPPPVSGTVTGTGTPAPVVAASPATSAASPQPTVDPVLAAEVGKAYERYWDVRAAALYNLDTSHLSEVSNGTELAALEAGINKLRDEGKAVTTNVTHDYRVTLTSPITAEIFDRYIDISSYIDPLSHVPLASDASQDQQADMKTLTVEEIYQLQKLDSDWKVVTVLALP